MTDQIRDRTIVDRPDQRPDCKRQIGQLGYKNPTGFLRDIPPQYLVLQVKVVTHKVNMAVTDVIRDT